MRRARLLLLLALLAGCAVEVPLGDPGLDEPGVLARAEALRTSPTTRQQVQAALGTPLLAAPDGSADVFHVTARQQQLALVMMFPLPSPALRHESYTLVVYDAEGAVAGVDSAYRRQGFGDIRQGVVLRAGDHEFLHADSDLLLVRPARYLAAHPDGEPGCTVLVGAAAPACAASAMDPSRCGVFWNRLQVDDGPARELPVVQFLAWRLDGATPGGADGPPADRARCEELGGHVATGSGPLCLLWRHALAPLRLAPGRHQLVASVKSLDGEARGRFECGDGEVVHALLQGEIAERYSLARQLGAGLRTGAVTGRITFSADPPPGLQGQRVILGW